ncbi:hypothetical protein ACFYUD_01210 [Nocardia tengchongensis]|uniref:hypothetical protein n=1 Tax=Nocardia tengchongensis TaxID=2055889 RepID=UPI00368B8C70
MRIRLLAFATAALTAAGLVAPAAASATAPGPDVRLADAVNVQALSGDARIVDRSVVLHTDLGTFRTTTDQLQILDPQGVVVGAIPLTITKQDTTYPIDARIDGDSATLTPSPDRARPVSAEERRIAAELHAVAEAQAEGPVAQQIADPDSFEDRMNTVFQNVNNELTVALAVGTLLGAVIGAPLGCVLLGAGQGLAVGALTLGTLAIPGAITGCLEGAVAGAGIGVVVFNLLVGVPAVLASAVHAFNVMTAPPAAAAESID